MSTLLSLWGRNPAGYLAGLGLTVVCPEAALTWSPGHEYAITSLDERELREVVLGDAARCRSATAGMVRAAEQVVAAAISR